MKNYIPNNRYRLEHISRSFFAVLVITMLLYAAAMPLPAQAQSTLDGWSDPVNLSRSGAASQPMIVAAPDGRLQVFWWDQFDGLITSVYQHGDWSQPAIAPIFGAQLTGTPQIVSDGTGKIHAFWSGILNRATNASSLMNAWMTFGGTIWSTPAPLAQSASVVEISSPPVGPISLAYVNTLNAPDARAGIYYKPATADGGNWGFDRLVYESIYYRLSAPQSNSIVLAGNGSNTQQMMWYDPNLAQLLYSYSSNDGQTWSTTETIGEPKDSPNHPRLTAMPDYSLRIWQATSLGSCVLYQQQSKPGAGQSTSNPLAPSAENAQTWSEPQRIFENLSVCPSSDSFHQTTSDQRLFWLWGAGSNTLGLSTWDKAQNSWSEVESFSFSFEDPETQRLVSLSNLQAAFLEDQIAVVGTDSSGEVWVTVSETSALELVFRPLPPWSNPRLISQSGQSPSHVTSSLDQQGRLFTVWSQVNSNGSVSIQISRQDSIAPKDGVLTNQNYISEIYRGRPGEVIRQPDILIDSENRLQLTWSGGTEGEIQYTWASVEEAMSPSGWSTPMTLSSSGLASSPKIAVDAAKTLYVVFSVPLNEGRGIYLSISNDRGETWTAPQQIFDAVGANWQQIDHPSLEATADGSLHVAFVDLGIPGAEATKGIYYLRSPDGGETWDTVNQLALDRTDWPQLAIANGQIHLIYLAANSSGAFHRWAPLISSTSSDSGWSNPFQIPGWQKEISAFGVAVDGRPEVAGTLHLVGSSNILGDVLYNTWDGQAWSDAETYVPFSIPAMPLPNRLVAATRPEGGILAVNWIALLGDDQQPALLMAARNIPTATVPDAPPIEPTQELLVTPSPVPEVLPSPSPTPALSNTPTPTGSIPAILIGGIIATVVVVVIFIWRLLFLQRK